MRETITLNVGHTGCNIANSVWELICLEHGVQPDAHLPEEAGSDGRCRGLDSFFHEPDKGKYVPRTLFCDLEPETINTIRAGRFGSLFNPEQMIAGKEDASNCFAEGYLGIGRHFIYPVMERVRREAEKCDALNNFLVFRSLSGGTGSGFGTLLMDRLCEEFGKKGHLELCTYSGPRYTVPLVEAYNAVLAIGQTVEYSDCTFMVDNKSVSDICRRNLGADKGCYEHINQLIAKTVSSMTASLRFRSPLSCFWPDEFCTTLWPYPRLHFPVLSYGPIVPPSQSNSSHSVQDLALSCVEPRNQLVRCSPQNAKYMSLWLQYRGDVSRRDIHEAVTSIQTNLAGQFVPWCPRGLKTDLCHQQPPAFENSDFGRSKQAVCAISHTTAIADVWSAFIRDFDTLYAKRAFAYQYYGRAMGEAFLEPRSNLRNLELDYREVASSEPNSGESGDNEY